MAKEQEIVYFFQSTGLNTEASRLDTKPSDLLEAENIELGVNFFVRPRRGIDFLDGANIQTTSVSNYQQGGVDKPLVGNGIFFQGVSANGTSVEYVILVVGGSILVYGGVTPVNNKIAFNDYVHLTLVPKQVITYPTTVGKGYFTDLSLNGNYVFLSNSFGHLGVLQIDPADTTSYNMLFTRLQVHARYINTVTEDPAMLTNAAGTTTAAIIGLYAWQRTPLPQNPGITSGNAVPTTRLANPTSSAPVYIEFSSGESLTASTGIPRPSKTEFYAGRYWLTGFSLRPNALYVSGTVQNETNYGQMYQVADPFSTLPNPVASDGAVIVIEGADVIRNMAAAYEDMVVFANNSIWVLSGNAGGGFSILDFKVTRISQEGLVGDESLVKVENDVYFFGQTNIQQVSINDNLAVRQNVKIQSAGDSILSLYQALPSSVKKTAKGIYDRGSQRIIWYMTGKTETATVIANSLQQPTNFRYALVYNLRTKGFSELFFSPSATNGYSIIGAFNAPTSKLRAAKPSLFVENRDVHYLILAKQNSGSGAVTLGVSAGKFYSDFGSVSAEAVSYQVRATLFDSVFKSLVAYKQNVFLFTAFKNAETSNTGAIKGACYLQSHYNWTNSPLNFSFGGFKPPISVYRPRNHGIASMFNNLEFSKDLVVNKTPFKGVGKAFSMTFSNSHGFSTAYPQASTEQKAIWDADVTKDFDLVGFAVGLRAFKRG